MERILDGRRMLSATLDHRFYDVHDKNFIKGSIEAHHLDHIMFSMRPTSKKILSECEGVDLERFRDLADTVLILQLMARYDIPVGVVEANFLEAESPDSVGVAEVESQVLSFLDEIEAALPEHVIAGKQLPWLFSVREVLPRLREARLIFFRSFAREQASTTHEYDDYQISNLEKHLFWVGFDPAFKQVPLDREYPETRWTELADKSDVGRGLYASKIRYCTRCCLPETMEGITFDEIGICVPCRSSEEKMHIDWEKRRADLDRIIDGFRSPNYYDCMLPMSGGKDSTYQAHVLKHVLDVTPLAVTHGQNWLSVAGRYNLENCLEKFDLDHIVFNMNRAIINKVARQSLAAIGDACWHCHIGAGTFPIETALAWDLDLMCWGESLAEGDGRSSYDNQAEASLFYNLEVSARIKAEDMANDSVSARDLSAWIYPSNEDLKDSKIRYIHLGNYFFWDEERQVEFIKRNYEWMDSPVENTYKGYKSVECVMAGVHDYANFIKRGIGRSTIHASEDVRRGILMRDEGFELAKDFDTQRPHALDFYLQLTGLSEDEFERTLEGDARSISAYASKLNDE